MFKPDMSLAPRRYVGAIPGHQCKYGVHWPTEEEYAALHAAKAAGERSRKASWTASAPVYGAKTSAHIKRDEDGKIQCHIVDTEALKAAQGYFYGYESWRVRKAWDGIPTWADEMASSVNIQNNYNNCFNTQPVEHHYHAPEQTYRIQNNYDNCHNNQPQIRSEAAKPSLLTRIIDACISPKPINTQRLERKQTSTVLLPAPTRARS